MPPFFSVRECSCGVHYRGETAGIAAPRRAKKMKRKMKQKKKPFTPEEMAERLQAQYAEIARLAGGLAHEVKNPLSTIRLNMELLGEDIEELPDSAQKNRSLKRVETVRRETIRLEELLNEFLNFTRAHHLELFTANVNRELHEAVEFIRPQTSALGAEVVEYFDPDVPTIRLDKRSFHRMILNLLLNAAQAMPDGGQIVVRTRQHAGDVVIDLIDTGVGMEEETIRKMFEPFYSTKLGGTGLGLPTVRRIVEGHGGRIAVQSEPGRGTQFSLSFPALPQISAEEKSEPIVLPDGSSGSSAEATRK